MTPNSDSINPQHNDLQPSDPQRDEFQPDLQQEIRMSRRFSIADVIGQEAGNFMKGESPVPKLVQAKGEAVHALKANLDDLHGALEQVLQRWLEDDEMRISRHLNHPINALVELLERILASPETFYELVRQADVRWGQLYDERPHFQRPGQAPHPDDDYTHESVRASLVQCLERLQNPLAKTTAATSDEAE